MWAGCRQIGCSLLTDSDGRPWRGYVLRGKIFGTAVNGRLGGAREVKTTMQTMLCRSWFDEVSGSRVVDDGGN